MPHAKVQFVYDKKNASSFGNKKGTVFVKGDLPELFRGTREYDKKITMDVVPRYHCGAVLIGGSDKEKISKIVDKEKNKSFVICFSGKKADYEVICEKYKSVEKPDEVYWNKFYLDIEQRVHLESSPTKGVPTWKKWRFSGSC